MDTLSARSITDYSKHEEIRRLLDEIIARFIKEGKPRFRDHQIFVEVLGDTLETQDAFLRFLHDVSTCPPKVIRWCQIQVNASPLRSV